MGSNPIRVTNLVYSMSQNNDLTPQQRLDRLQHANEEAQKQYLADMLDNAKSSGKPEAIARVERLIKKINEQKAIWAARPKTETDLQQMERLLGGPTSGKYSLTVGDERTLLHVGSEGCFVYDKDGNEVDMDF
jgi:hypothetical protein